MVAPAVVFPWTAAVREGSDGGEARRRECYARDDEFAITCHEVSLLLIEASSRGSQGDGSHQRMCEAISRTSPIRQVRPLQIRERAQGRLSVGGAMGAGSRRIYAQRSAERQRAKRRGEEPNSVRSTSSGY